MTGKNMQPFWKKLLGAVGIASFSLLGSTLAMTSAQAKQVELRAELGSPVIEAGKKQTTFLKIALTGFKLDDESDRTPANIAIVLDKSGSMGGDKLQSAKQAARMAVNLLNDNDIISIISYDSTVNVLVPATKVSDKKAIHRAIDRMRSNGKTALFAGVSKGAAEIRKFLDKDRVNRVILLSDGQANVGPSSPSQLGDLGASLSKDGITVTTIGLGTGYNEDLMANLAGYSDGNHAFVKDAEDLAKIFKYEFGDVLSVVAQDVEIKIQCKNGIKPIRILGRDGTILGQTVKTNMSQLYSEQEKFVLIEVEVPAGRAKQQVSLADVSVAYQNMQSNQQDKLADNMTIAYSASQADVRRALNRSVEVTATKQVANEASKEALRLRDQGQLKEAQEVLKGSARVIKRKAEQLGGSEAGLLNSFSSSISEDANTIMEEKDWNQNRKSLKARQYKLDKQQSY
ncbi:VWA domain-containing protein [Cocleimonas flava]|uniref:Ca-activated chloride channel family protein n=2 Tax=Cocleimonas flava TaxID=634765 RepID=A0A4R1F8F7_9GAMM|nr:Ca-activated chloride channel family protein [Cocleimonas flava]